MICHGEGLDKTEHFILVCMLSLQPLYNKRHCSLGVIAIGEHNTRCTRRNIDERDMDYSVFVITCGNTAWCLYRQKKHNQICTALMKQFWRTWKFNHMHLLNVLRMLHELNTVVASIPGWCTTDVDRSLIVSVFVNTRFLLVRFTCNHFTPFVHILVYFVSMVDADGMVP